MSLRNIDVKVSHNLGLDEAAKKLRSWLEVHQNDGGGNFTLKAFSWADEGTKYVVTFAGTVSAGFVHETVRGKVDVTHDYVHIKTDQLPLFAIPGVLVAQAKITRTLKELLQ